MKQSRTQKIIVVGATGLIGTQVVAQLSLGDRVPGYEVMGVTHETEPGLDLTSPGPRRGTWRGSTWRRWRAR
ncbi:MAG: hypothetical protein KC933_01080 [Myxococcales bacterium]|nr:hypothetical protein [Myxococcales bacterium]